MKTSGCTPGTLRGFNGMPLSTCKARAYRARKLQTVAAASPTASSFGSAVRELQASKELASGVAPQGTPLTVPVPGTEILAGPPPQPLPPPSQGMDFVLKSLNEAAPTLKASTSAASSSMSDVAGSLQGGATAAASQASAAAADAAAAAQSAAANVAGQVGGIASSAEEVYGRLQGEAGAAVSGVQGEVSSLVGNAQAAADSAVSSVVGQAQAQISALLDQVPPEVKEVLLSVASTAAKAFHTVAADSTLGPAALGVSIGLPALLAWQAAYGGFAGSLTAEKTLELLQHQDALLVDVRPEPKRLEAGVPELKRGARGKGVAMPMVQLFPSVARRVRNADDLAVQILGAQIAALARAGPRTRIVIMDERGDRAKAVARAATAAGARRVYVLLGGFRGWQAAGLQVEERASEYDASPLALVGDAAESVAEEAAGLLRNPVNSALAVGGIAGAALFAFNYHVVLQFIGVVGVEATVAWRLLQYDSPQEALEDAKGFLYIVSNAASGSAQAVQRLANNAGQELQDAAPQEEQQQQQQPTQSSST